jgi:hypothetical protein
MNEESVLSAYITLIDADILLEGRATVSRKDDEQAVGIVARPELLDRIAEIYRERGHHVVVAPSTGALQIRRR